MRNGTMFSSVPFIWGNREANVSTRRDAFAPIRIMEHLPMCNEAQAEEQDFHESVDRRQV